MTDLTKAGFDHPCKQTCSGWEQGRERGFHEGQESAFRKVVELIREVSTQEQDIFSKNDYVRYLLANKDKILGDEK